MTTNPPAGTNVVADALLDIVGPVPVTSPLGQAAMWAAVLLLLAAAAFFARWWFKQRTLIAKPSAPPVPPHERARRRLDEALRLISDPDRFCTEVSGILRVYLEERFGWNAPDRTTQEFLAELRMQEDLSDTLQERLGEFLSACDLVKFARYDPTETELRDLHRVAVRLVEDTVPPPVIEGVATNPVPTATRT